METDEQDRRPKDEIYGAFCLRKSSNDVYGSNGAETEQLAFSLVDKMKNAVSMAASTGSDADSDALDEDSYFDSVIDHVVDEIGDDSESSDSLTERKRLRNEIHKNYDHLPEGTLFGSDVKSQDALAIAKSSGKATAAAKLMERWLPLDEDMSFSKGIVGVADMPSKTAAKYNQFPFSIVGDFMKCPHCDDRVFKYHRDLVRHVMQTHYPFVLRWVCTVCNMPDSTAFKRKNDLVIHYRRHHRAIHPPDKNQAFSYTISYNNQYIPPTKVCSSETPFPFTEEVLEDAFHLSAWQTTETPIPPLPSEDPCQKLGPFSIFGLDYGDANETVKVKKNHTADEKNAKEVHSSSVNENRQKLSVSIKRGTDDVIETTTKRVNLDSCNEVQPISKKFKLISSELEKRKGKRKREKPQRFGAEENGVDHITIMDSIDLTDQLSSEETSALEYDDTSHGAIHSEPPKLTPFEYSPNDWQQAVNAIEQSTSQLNVPSTPKEMDTALTSQRSKISILERASEQFQSLLATARASEAQLVQRSFELKFEHRLKQLKSNHAMEIADLHDVIKKLTDENENLKSKQKNRRSSVELKRDNINLGSRVSALEVESDLYFNAFIKAAAVLPSLPTAAATSQAKTMAKDLGQKLASCGRTIQRFGSTDPEVAIVEILEQEREDLSEAEK